VSAPSLNLPLDPQDGAADRHGLRVAAIAAQPTASAREVYLALLTWAFTLFNSVRVFSYLPTLWAIHTSGDSSQHSLVTWLTWLGANVTMALWLYEHNGQRCNRAVMVNAGNAAMCVVTALLIVWHRF
jgi:hypothetical protein